MRTRFSTTQLDAALGLNTKDTDPYKNSWETKVSSEIVEAQKELIFLFTQVLQGDFFTTGNFEIPVKKRILPKLKVLEQAGLIKKEVRTIVCADFIQKEDIARALEIIENVRNEEKN